MEVRPVIFVLLLVSSVSGYNIKINPIVKTAVTNLKNTGDKLFDCSQIAIPRFRDFFEAFHTKFHTNFIL